MRKFRLIRKARHETIIGRFKEWGCLKQTYRHAEDKHYDVLMAVAGVITQLDMWDGRPAWRVVSTGCSRECF